jgi:hypothetical protein
VIAAALTARSVALAGFGLDSLIEISASAIVIWQLKDPAANRERRALRLIGIARTALPTQELTTRTSPARYPRNRALASGYTAHAWAYHREEASAPAATSCVSVEQDRSVPPVAKLPVCREGDWMRAS